MRPSEGSLDQPQCSPLHSFPLPSSQHDSWSTGHTYIHVSKRSFLRFRDFRDTLYRFFMLSCRDRYGESVRNFTVCVCVCGRVIWGSGNVSGIWPTFSLCICSRVNLYCTDAGLADTFTWIDICVKGGGGYTSGFPIPDTDLPLACLQLCKK